MRIKTLTTVQIMARMRRGDLPTLKGGYSNKSMFEDGAVASHQTMTKLWRAGKIVPPIKTSVSSPWTLAEASNA